MVGGLFLRVELDGVAQLAQPALGDQPLVDRPEPSLEGGVHRNAQRDGLAIHRAAGGDHEVGEGDQRLRVDRLLGDDEAGHAGKLRALGRGAGQHHRLHPLRAAAPRRADARAPARRDRSRNGGRARPPGGCAPRRSAARGRAPARRGSRGRARSRRGSTPPSAPRRRAPCRARHSGRGARAGIASGTTTARARRQLIWCCTVAHS